MTVLLIIVLAVAIFGYGGYTLGGPNYSYHSGGIGVGTVLIIALVLYLMGII